MSTVLFNMNNNKKMCYRINSMSNFVRPFYGNRYRYQKPHCDKTVLASPVGME